MKHILFLTWKDISHPQSGGAELVIFEYAQRLVRDGYRVTWFGSSFPGAKETQIIDGIIIIRKYSIYTIYFFAHIWYKKFIKNNPVDIIVDEAGGIPLLSPLYVKNIPIYFFIHHIGYHEYKTTFPFPLNKLFQRFVFWSFSLYKNLPTITVSESTAQELRKCCSFTNITVIENACHIKAIDTLNWSLKKNEIVFLGRLTPMKRVDETIRAFYIFGKNKPQFILNIVGNTQNLGYLKKLKKLVIELGLTKNVFFIPYGESTIKKYLRSAKVMLISSINEGYGLIVLEGNSFGIPVIAYNVPGIRDSIKNGINGYLVKDGNTQLLAETLDKLIDNEALLKNLSESSLNHRKELGGWNEKYIEFKKILLSNTK